MNKYIAQWTLSQRAWTSSDLLDYGMPKACKTMKKHIMIRWKRSSQTYTGPIFFLTTSFQRWATTSFPGLDIEILLPLPSRCPGNALIGPRIRCSSLPRGIMSICPLFAQRLDRVNTKSHLCFHPWHSFPPFLTLHARPSHNKSQHTSSNGVQLFSWAREWNSRQTK